MYTGNPNSPPPGSWAPGDNALGVQHAVQAKQAWAAGETDIRPVASAIRAQNLWRLTVLGNNVLVRISYGTSAAKILQNIRTPIRVTLPGSVDVYAQPLNLGGEQAAASVQVTLTPVTSGCCESDCRKIITAGGGLLLEDDAVRYVALAASVVALDLTNVNVPVLQSVSLVSGAVLVSGTGYLEFSP